MIIFEKIAGILPENSNNNFVDQQSQKAVRQTEKFVFSLKADVIFWNLYKFLLPLLAALK